MKRKQQPESSNTKNSMT